MDQYKLYKAVSPVLDYLEDLTNWYVKLNKLRMVGREGIEE